MDWLLPLQRAKAACILVKASARYAIARLRGARRANVPHSERAPRALAAAVALGATGSHGLPPGRQLHAESRRLTNAERAYVRGALRRFADDIEDASNQFRAALEKAGIFSTQTGFLAIDDEASADSP
jgi:hypothetical protein